MVTASIVNKLVEEKTKDIEKFMVESVKEMDEKIEEYAKRGFPKFSFTFYIPTESRERFKKFVSEYYTMLGFYGSISDKGDFIEVYLSSIKEDPDSGTIEEHREDPVNE